MKLTIILTIIFILYEMFKMFVMNKYWKFIINKNSIFINVMEFSYSFFFVYLLFTKFWYIGICIFLSSIITISGLNIYLKNNIPMNIDIKRHLIFDGITSIILLLLIIIRETV